MNTKNTNPVSEIDDELAPRKLDWSKAVRGKYYNRFQQGTNLVVLAPDLMDTFPDSEAVNRALRAFVDMTANQHEKVSTSPRATTTSPSWSSTSSTSAPPPSSSSPPSK
jgi:hypothetical protein